MSDNPFRAWRELARTRGFKLVVVGLIFLLTLLFIYRLRHVFNPVLIGGVVAYILEPMIRMLTGRGWSRRLSIVAVYTVMLTLTGLVAFASVVAFTKQADQLLRAVDQDVYVDSNQNGVWDSGEVLTGDHNGNGRFDQGYRDLLRVKATRFAGWWNSKVPSMEIDTQDLQQATMEGLDTFMPSGGGDKDLSRNFWTLLERSFGGWLRIAVGVIMIPIYAFFLQMLVPPMRRTLPQLVPEAVRDKTFQIVNRIDRELSAFFRGKVIVCLLKALFTTFGLQMLDLPFAFFVGFLAGGLSIVPYLGAVVGMVIALGISVLETGGFDLVIWIVLLFVVMEVIEFFLNLIVFGREVGIHPLAFILALFIGGELFGLFGLIMAVPLVSVITILYKEFLDPVLQELAHPEKAPHI